MLRNEIHIHLLFRLIVLIRRLCTKLLNNNDNNKMHGSQSDGFPNDPMFIQLRRLTTELPGVLFHDEYGIDAGYTDVISDVIHLRQVLRDVLPGTSFNGQGCLQDNATSIAFLATSQYYFIVSFLAIAALGGVCVPLGESTISFKAVQRY